MYSSCVLADITDFISEVLPWSCNCMLKRRKHWNILEEYTFMKNDDFSCRPIVVIFFSETIAVNPWIIIKVRSWLIHFLEINCWRSYSHMTKGGIQNRYKMWQNERFLGKLHDVIIVTVHCFCVWNSLHPQALHS